MNGDAAIMTNIKTVAVVSKYPHEHVLDSVLGAVNHDVVVLQSTAHAYSQIKQVTPDLVILCLSGDDADACQVLSMLALDHETSRIPVMTYSAARKRSLADDVCETDDDAFSFGPGSLN